MSGSLSVERNDTLFDINGLNLLTTVGADLSIVDNPALCLTDITALTNGITVTGISTVSGNDDGC